MGVDNEFKSAVGTPGTTTVLRVAFGPTDIPFPSPLYFPYL